MLNRTENIVKVTILKHRNPLAMAICDNQNIKPMDCSYYNLDMTKKELSGRLLIDDVKGLIILLGERRYFNQEIRNFLLNTMSKAVRNASIVIDERDEYLM